MTTWVLIMWFWIGGEGSMAVIGHYESDGNCMQMGYRVQKSLKRQDAIFYCVEEPK